MKQLEKTLVPIDVNLMSKEQLNSAIKIARYYKSEIIYRLVSRLKPRKWFLNNIIGAPDY
jgi:hypothetical protein